MLVRRGSMICSQPSTWIRRARKIDVSNGLASFVEFPSLVHALVHRVESQPRVSSLGLRIRTCRPKPGRLLAFVDRDAVRISRVYRSFRSAFTDSGSRRRLRWRRSARPARLSCRRLKTTASYCPASDGGKRCDDVRIGRNDLCQFDSAFLGKLEDRHCQEMSNSSQRRVIYGR